MTIVPSARLAELGIELPAVAAPVAAYIPAQRVGNEVRTFGPASLRWWHAGVERGRLANR